MPDAQNLEQLLALFNFKRKREAARHCRDLVVYKGDFAALVLAAGVRGIGPYLYACHFDERQPEHLNPTAEEHRAAARVKVGKLEGKAGKFFSKTLQMFEERRLFAAHLFYTATQRYWHLFYFDQRDMSEERNHWRHGAHIHYASDLFVRDSLESVWQRVQAGETTFLGALHVRYKRHV